MSKVLGEGNTAKIYELDESKVLKLFDNNFSRESILKEYNNALAIKDMLFKKPQVLDYKKIDNCYGIVYEKISGISLLEWIIDTVDIESCSVNMAKLHKKILANKVNNVSSYKDFIKSCIKGYDKTEEYYEMLNLLDKLPDSDYLCHGDYHPGNILITNGEMYVIDFMNICTGPRLYDIARTVYLIESYKSTDTNFKKVQDSIIGLYLEEMNVEKCQLEEYLKVISFARNGEIIS